jgi:hypothetical protein
MAAIFGVWINPQHSCEKKYECCLFIERAYQVGKLLAQQQIKFACDLKSLTSMPPVVVDSCVVLPTDVVYKGSRTDASHICGGHCCSWFSNKHTAATDHEKETEAEETEEEEAGATEGEAG